MATLPDVAVTGTVIESAWGNDVRAAVTENPAYLAAAQGDLFRATGAGAIERFPSLGPGVLVADSNGAAPSWETGAAGQFPRVNLAGTAIEFVGNPAGSELIASALTTGTSVNFSSLGGLFTRYRLYFAAEEFFAGSIPTLKANGLSSGYAYSARKDEGAGAAWAGNFFTTAWSLPGAAGGAGTNTGVRYWGAIDVFLIEDNISVIGMTHSMNRDTSARAYGEFGGFVAATSITALALSWAYSAFATDQHARYALYGLR